MLTCGLFRLIGVLFRLIGVLFRLAGVLFGLTICIEAHPILEIGSHLIKDPEEDKRSKKNIADVNT